MSLSDFTSRAYRQNKLRLRLLALQFTCLSFALTSCATYKPPELPEDQKATIYLSQFPYTINFQKIDGVDVALGSSLRAVTMQSLEVAPGRHTVSIRIAMRFFEETYDGAANISFVAKPGKTYIVKTQISGSDHQSLRAWAEESKPTLTDP